MLPFSFAVPRAQGIILYVDSKHGIHVGYTQAICRQVRPVKAPANRGVAKVIPGKIGVVTVTDVGTASTTLTVHGAIR